MPPTGPQTLALVPLHACTARPGPNTDWAYLLWHELSGRSWWANDPRFFDTGRR